MIDLRLDLEMSIVAGPRVLGCQHMRVEHGSMDDDSRRIVNDGDCRCSVGCCVVKEPPKPLRPSSSLRSSVPSPKKKTLYRHTRGGSGRIGGNMTALFRLTPFFIGTHGVDSLPSMAVRPRCVVHPSAVHQTHRPTAMVAEMSATSLDPPQNRTG